MVCMTTVLFPLQKRTEGCGLHGYSLVSFTKRNRRLWSAWLQSFSFTKKNRRLWSAWLQSCFLYKKEQKVVVCMATVLFPLQKGTEGCGLHGYSLVSFTKRNRRLWSAWLQSCFLYKKEQNVVVCMATVLFPLQKGTESCGLHGYSLVSFTKRNRRLWSAWLQSCFLYKKEQKVVVCMATVLFPLQKGTEGCGLHGYSLV